MVVAAALVAAAQRVLVELQPLWMPVLAATELAPCLTAGLLREVMVAARPARLTAALAAGLTRLEALRGVVDMAATTTLGPALGSAALRTAAQARASGEWRLGVAAASATLDAAGALDGMLTAAL